ncbi:hypothetical protein B0I35DRAFT_79458 [Stachybotrys elegans]|uniref:Uncharacterized protein n=1 Tax=Stachybotrys elegans TaxID=80388 RepID=A0A8K0SKK4_9HYPO|nr:hypothetical protein B0I35DRAFT_79458 [Stachybotrys elegans]
MNALLQRMERHLAAMRAADPTGRVRSTQSPQYVGCSENLQARLSDYKNVYRASKPLGLVRSILAAYGIPVSLCRKVVARTLTKEQIPLAEQLVMTLAGSFVWRCDFNVAEGGRSTYNHATGWDHAERIVFEKVFVHSNLNGALADTSDRAAFLDLLQDNSRRLDQLAPCLEDLARVQGCPLSGPKPTFTGNSPNGLTRHWLPARRPPRLCYDWQCGIQRHI